MFSLKRLELHKYCFYQNKNKIVIEAQAVGKWPLSGVKIVICEDQCYFNGKEKQAGDSEEYGGGMLCFWILPSFPLILPPSISSSFLFSFSLLSLHPLFPLPLLLFLLLLFSLFPSLFLFSSLSPFLSVHRVGLSGTDVWICKEVVLKIDKCIANHFSCNKTNFL